MADRTKSVRVELTGDTNKFQAALKAASKSVNDFGQSVGSVQKALSGGAGLFGGIGTALSSIASPAGIATSSLAALGAAVGGLAVFVGGAIKELAAFSETLINLRDSTGLSLTELQELNYQAKTSGSSLEEAAAAVTKMQKAIVEGDSVFERLGLSIEKLRALKPGEQFELVAKAIVQIEDPAQQAAAAMEAFGKSGTSLLPLLKSDLAAAREEAHRLGVVLSDETIESAKGLGDQAEMLGIAWEGFKTQIAAVVVDSGLLKSALEEITALATQLIGPIAQNKDALALLFREAVKDAGALVEKLQLLIGIGASLTLGPTFGFLKKAFVDAGEAVKKIQAGIDQQKKFAGENKPAAEGKGAGGRTFTSQQDIDKAKKSAEAYQKELERINEEERKGAIESNKRWAKEQADIEKVNEAVRKRLSDASVSIFGTSKEAARDAGLAFQDLQTVLERSGKTIADLSANELARYEEQLVEIEKKTRDDADANEEVATTLGQVRARLREVGEDGFEGIKARTEEVKVQTIDWGAALQDIANLVQSLPGALGKVGSAFAGVTAGIAGIGGAIDSFKKAGAAGGLGGLLGQIGAAGQIASAAIGIGKAIVGLFKKDPIKEAQKKVGKALGHGISREMAEQFLNEAKATGKSIEQVAKEWKIKLEAEQAQANADKLREGVQIAQQGAESLIGIMDKLSPAAQAAGQRLIQSVVDALANNGLGFMATGDLAKNEQFNAVQQAVAGAGQVIGGFRQAGAISTDLLSQGGAFADALRQQAVEAALAAGKTQEEAQRIGLATIAPLLRDQLNASIESGQELDANTKALLEEARANGIEIVADPLIAQLETQREMLAELKKQNGAAGRAGDAIERGRGTKVSAATGANFFTGSGSPQMQLHPNEWAFVMPNAGNMADVSARIGESAPWEASAHIGGPGQGVVYQPSYELTIPLSGPATRRDGEAVAAGFIDAMRRRDPEMMAQLEIWLGPRRGGR